VNAAPSTEALGENGFIGGDDNANAMEVRPDLMGALRDKLGPIASTTSSGDGERMEEGSRMKKMKVEKPKDDYAKFMDEIGGILGPNPS
jgi:hypothetical protein